MRLERLNKSENIKRSQAQNTPISMGLDALPPEILWKLLVACPHELRCVNRTFYHLHNELYREHVMKLLNAGEQRFWNELKEHIIAYIKSLDFLRKSSRLVITAGQEYIDDSWYIIYNALSYPLKCWNNPALCERDSLDFQKPIYAGKCVVPADCCGCNVSSKIGRRIPLNAWFYIENAFAAAKIPRFVTEIRQSQYGSYNRRSIQGNVADFVKEAGVYCFSLGTLPDICVVDQAPVNGTYFCPFELRLVGVGLAPPTYFENSGITFLGYDFNNYESSKPWIMFRVGAEFASSIFNPFESLLSSCLAKYTGAFPFSSIERPSQDTCEETIKPYFDTEKRAIREFVYRYPRVQQDWDKEWKAADWRAPHLIA